MVQIAHLDELSQNYWVVVLTQRILERKSVKKAIWGIVSEVLMNSQIAKILFWYESLRKLESQIETINFWL